jgi:hypothetical protein
MMFVTEIIKIGGDSQKKMIQSVKLSRATKTSDSRLKTQDSDSLKMFSENAYANSEFIIANIVPSGRIFVTAFISLTISKFRGFGHLCIGQTGRSD